MKTIIRSTRLIIILAFLPALLSVAQAGAVEYKNSYQRSAVGYQLSTVGYQGATAPSATFQSTSAYSSQWQEEEQVSMLNSDGSIANSPLAAAPSGPRRAPGTPGGQLDPTSQQPIGDGLWALMLCACVYAVYTVARRRKEA